SPWHAILPTLALGLYFSGRVARLMRAGMLNTLQAVFITTARAKGLSETAVLLKHAFRLAVLPVVSYSVPLMADRFTGSVVIVSIFHLPGFGLPHFSSSLNLGYTVVVWLSVLYSGLLIVLNLAFALAYFLLYRRLWYD